MKYQSRPALVMVIWFIWTLLCGTTMLTGIFLLCSWPHIFRNLSLWLRLSGGIVFVVGGFMSAYFATMNFFWYVARWISKVRIHNEIALSKGPKVVVIGGGTGLGTILRGLKKITANLTAIVTMADDGGSSGKLRAETGMLPPGDIRNCLVAMADLEPLMEKLMQYRFKKTGSLAGHNFGNLFIAVMVGIFGDFEQAIKETSKVLAVRGQVLPSTTDSIQLKARLIDGREIIGESAIPQAGAPIEKVSLEPVNVTPLSGVLTAIKEADVILLGPGSLYTSIIPNLLVPGIADAIRESVATKVYVCNVMTQHGETDGYSASQHVETIIKHAGRNLIDIAVINTAELPLDVLEKYAEEGAEPVAADVERIEEMGITALQADVLNCDGVIRHDAEKMSKLVDELARTGRMEIAFGKQLIRTIFRMVKQHKINRSRK